MVFKRKFWKRGDKLNAKELNRIEEGIANNMNGGSGSDSNVSGVLHCEAYWQEDGDWFYQFLESDETIQQLVSNRNIDKVLVGEVTNGSSSGLYVYYPNRYYINDLIGFEATGTKTNEENLVLTFDNGSIVMTRT